MPGESLIGRVTHAALVVLLVAVACNFGWRIMQPVVPVVIVLVVFGWLYGRLIRRR